VIAFVPQRRLLDVFGSSVFILGGLVASAALRADLPIRLAGLACLFIGAQNVLRLFLTVVEVSPGLVRYRPFFTWFEFRASTIVSDERIALLVGVNQNILLTPPSGRKMRISSKRFGPELGECLVRSIHEALGGSDDTFIP
jgi:hypothetical protein